MASSFVLAPSLRYARSGTFHQGQKWPPPLYALLRAVSSNGPGQKWDFGLFLQHAHYMNAYSAISICAFAVWLIMSELKLSLEVRLETDSGSEVLKILDIYLLHLNQFAHHKTGLGLHAGLTFVLTAVSQPNNPLRQYRVTSPSEPNELKPGGNFLIGQMNRQSRSVGRSARTVDIVLNLTDCNVILGLKGKKTAVFKKQISKMSRSQYL
jgi:hypothetical protein